MPAHLMGLLAIGTFYLLTIVVGMCATRCLAEEDDSIEKDQDEDNPADSLDLLDLLEHSLSKPCSRDQTAAELNHAPVAKLHATASGGHFADGSSPLEALSRGLPNAQQQQRAPHFAEAVSSSKRAPKLGAIGRSVQTSTTSGEAGRFPIEVLDTTTVGTPDSVMHLLPTSASAPTDLAHGDPRLAYGSPRSTHASPPPASVYAASVTQARSMGYPASVRGDRPLGSPMGGERSSSSTYSSRAPPLPVGGRYLLADRNIGWLMGTLSMLAIKTGGVLPNALAQQIYGQGLLWCQVPVASSLGLVVGGSLFARAMYGEGYVTLVDPFQTVYGSRVAALLFVPVLVADVFYASVVVSSLGALQQMTLGLESWVGVTGSVVAILFYLLIGGFYAGTFTDALQYIYLLLGLMMLAPYVCTNESITKPLFQSEQWVGDLNGRNSGLFIDQFVMLILGSVPMQSYFQRMFSVRSAHVGGTITLLSSIGVLFTAVPTVFIGLAAAATDWSNTTLGGPIPTQNETLILPYSMAYIVPSAVKMLALGALTSGLLASGDSAIFGLATMMSMNVYKGFFRANATNGEIIWVTRLSVVLFCGLVLALCLYWDEWYYYWLLPFDLLYVLVFPQLFCVLYFKYTNSWGALTGLWVGVVVRFCFGEPLIKLDAVLRLPFHNPSEGQLFPYRTLAMLANLMTIIGASVLAHRAHKAGWLPSPIDICKTRHKHKRRRTAGPGTRRTDDSGQRAGQRRSRASSMGGSPPPGGVHEPPPLTITSLYRHGSDRDRQRGRRHSPLIERMTVL